MADGMASINRIGLDVGSTTLKVVCVDATGDALYHEYLRHNADVAGTLHSVFERLARDFADARVRMAVTGSAGMGICERSGLPFVQEVVAACRVVEQKYPEAASLVDIGGEDAKMIFFGEGRTPDIRMNGSCAGGTGAFIDQMAVLLGVDVGELAGLAERATRLHPIASRCGVFSKTDVQNLLARGAKREDIAASIFHAVSVQVLTTLSRGYYLREKVVLCGGPFFYIAPLRRAFAEAAGLEEAAFVLPECANAIPAWGAALSVGEAQPARTFGELLELLEQSNAKIGERRGSLLPPLFESEAAYEAWRQSKEQYRLPTAPLESAVGEPCFLGIDSGSTTTKLVLLNARREIVFRLYCRNAGNPLGAVTGAFEELMRECEARGLSLEIGGSCVTGYGEDLVRKAFGLNMGMVETLAHYAGASYFAPDVSFILDIGGQDMKAAFIENGTVSRLEINEACSSGCGSFIETFATGLGLPVEDFARAACSARMPSDLGTRCTVFMNSRVKQSLREGASKDEISAGLGYSVVRNCLHKVLKLKDFSVLGERVMVQGGTMRNPAVCRAFEIETGRDVIITDAPELMGAFGAALIARRESRVHAWAARPLGEVARVASYSCSDGVCQGCYNRCAVTTFRFENGERYFAGNKCERVFSNGGEGRTLGANMSEWKYERTFAGAVLDDNEDVIPVRGGERVEGAASAQSAGVKPLVMGIPRVLGMYEHYPFWSALFEACGFRVELSAESSMRLGEMGAHTVMSDNICFPAKLAHGHVLDLAKRGVDRIFLPFVVHEEEGLGGADNSFNCPVVSGYSEVLRSTLGREVEGRIPLDAPSISFRDAELLERQCWRYIYGLRGDGVAIPSRSAFRRAFAVAVQRQEAWARSLRDRNMEVAQKAIDDGRLLIMLASRPYHTDPLIQQKVGQIISEFGVDLVTEDLVRDSVLERGQSESIHQWAYTNRIVAAARWAATAGEHVHYVQITSFGCGPDAYVVDEAMEVLQRAGKTATMLKVDDVSNVGSLRLRIRSLVESLRQRRQRVGASRPEVRLQKPFGEEDRRRTILMPWFGDAYSPYLPVLFKLGGYKAVNLPPSDAETPNYGLRYSNNEICYPATLVVGDFMKAMASGKYRPEDVAFGITQTGGQCRATNYMSLVKHALAQAGYPDVPVISVTTSDLNEQPGFRIAWGKMMKPILRTMVYADVLAVLYNTARVREKRKGHALELFEEYTQLGLEQLEAGRTKALRGLLTRAADDFGAAIRRVDLPRVGIVGEIFVKYNSFANRGLVDWICEHGMEPVIPSLMEFFLEGLASRVVRAQERIDRRTLGSMLTPGVEAYVFSIIRGMERAVSAYPYYRPIGKPLHEASLARPIINLNAQFGEGWLIPASFARFAQEGVNSVVCMQPFGCIANHIIAKGIEKRVRDMYPQLNILFLDLDSGVSDVNFFNRLHFLMEGAKAGCGLAG